MQDTASTLVKAGLVIGAAILALGIRQWWVQSSAPPPRALKLQQNWELEMGSRVGDYLIVGGLGDISLDLRGDAIYAPFDGKVEPYAHKSCVLFSSAEIPAYLFRFCGLERLSLGAIKAGRAIGSARYLQFATLRKQPNGSWAIVEPSREVLEKVLSAR